VIRCSDCPREYHVSCAWEFDHKFGFEIQPVRHPDPPFIFSCEIR
jgi:hypothetical protein